MSFQGIIRFKIGFALGFLGLLMTFKPAMCWGQVEIDQDHYENTNDSSVPAVQPRAKLDRNNSKLRGKSAPIQPQQTSTSTLILWNNAALEAAHDNNSGSLVMGRVPAMMHTAMFDAWAHHDDAARPAVGSIVLRPENERTTENKQEALSYAAQRVLVDLVPSSTARLDRLMMTLGYNPMFELQDNENQQESWFRLLHQVLRLSTCRSKDW